MTWIIETMCAWGPVEWGVFGVVVFALTYAVVRFTAEWLDNIAGDYDDGTKMDAKSGEPPRGHRNRGRELAKERRKRDHGHNRINTW